MRIPREAARVAVLAPDGAVFLFRYDNEEVGVHWAMPGGGLDPGESRLQAAARELVEETGWADVPLDADRVLCTWTHDYTRAGVPVRQHEVIFLAPGPRRDPLGDLSASHAGDGILDWRWWSPADLADPRAEPVWPPQLPVLLADAPGHAPVDLGYVPVAP
ncbi:NUDIX hydrolase [Streptomyces millisiae]|uniref:NUDIX domain-containing protein n=1 Tax=Streptomyces millisiae TaxID=3075542 RepID=A0ABU2LJ11_9ACTN|nr:NUDIX domain-containing protein [Streptomyces sp. DSM 44918]MDT0317559.1 NUDIX domain-containing protein [Streptomyces sp. DSM 44918]